jgi:hypothetical protein
MQKFILGLVFVFLTVSLFAQNTSDFEIQGNDDGTMTILNYKGMAKDIIIPEKIFNMPVTRLREGAFKSKGLTSITVPATVTFIGNETFRNNQLRTIILLESIEYIGNYAFAQNQLTSIIIPPKVLTIGDSAFRQNQLTEITIPDSVTYIGYSAFYGNRLQRVIIGNGTVYIGNSAFGAYDNRNIITSLVLGTSIKYIGEATFQEHQLSSIVFPSGLVFIGRNAFQPDRQISLTSITIGKYVMFGGDGSGNAFSNNADFDTIYQNNDKRAGKYAYANGNWSYTP